MIKKKLLHIVDREIWETWSSQAKSTKRQGNWFVYVPSGIDGLSAKGTLLHQSNGLRSLTFEGSYWASHQTQRVGESSNAVKNYVRGHAKTLVVNAMAKINRKLAQRLKVHL